MEHTHTGKTGKHCHGGHCHNHAGPGDSDSRSLSATIRHYRREIISALLLLLGLYFSHFGVFQDISMQLGSSFDWVSLVWYIAAVLPVGIPVVKETVESWSQGNVMNEFTLMVAATIGAFVIGEYPEGVSVLLFYSFGEKLEDTASDNVKRRIKNLLGKLPDSATIIVDGIEKRVKPQDVAPGSELFVRPGEKVPVDALLLGDSEIDFDTSAITGESVPRSFAPGKEISAGMIPVDKAIRLETVRPFKDSSMSRIMAMIENAAESKAPTETVLRKITRYYTPIVFSLAALVFIVPLVYSLFSSSFDFQWMSWLRRSLVFLVCSCPCALVVSIPLSYFISIGNASRFGMLFKGSKYIDEMRKVDVVFFDKTGTLTTGQFHISGIAPSDGTTADILLATAASLDADSNHPLAKAIVESAKEKRLNVPKASDVKTVSHGITGIIDGKNVSAGSRKLMQSMDVKVPTSASDASEICVAVDGKYIGSIYLLDNVKPDAAEAIRELHRLGVGSVEILSGDLNDAVERVRKIVGADVAHSNLLPADKQKIVEEAVKDGKQVVFAGDGINDAPAIAASNVGVAMGTLGTDVAMESADMVIAGDDIAKIPAAIRLARKVRRVIVENVTFALGVKATVMVLGAFGIATLWAAVFADTGVTLITIIWTMLRLSATKTPPK